LTDSRQVSLAARSSRPESFNRVIVSINIADESRGV
jgi:hypothetical protein